MANERDEDQFSDREDDTRKERGQGEQETRISGQPIGGNDSNTGTGTATTQGFDSSAGAGSAGAAGGTAPGSTGTGGSTSQSGTNEYGAQSTGAQAEGGAAGTDTTAGARGSSAGAGSSGFVGSQGQESGEYLQEDDPQQAGFAERGRGAPEEGRDIERGGERTANRDSDIEGSSENR